MIKNVNKQKNLFGSLENEFFDGTTIFETLISFIISLPRVPLSKTPIGVVELPLLQWNYRVESLLLSLSREETFWISQYLK